jgi:hypothetical protein
MRAHIALFSFAFLASSALGCGGTVEIPRICFKQAGLAVLGSPAGVNVETPPVSFRIDITNQIPLLRTNTSDTDLRVDQVTITPVAGTTPDLSGIQTAKVQAQSPSGQAVDVVRYQRDPAAPPPAAIVLDGATRNIAPDLVSGQANLSFTLSGQPPTTGWTADVETCMHATASVSP